MADVLIALGGNVGDVRATFRKAIANICGMTQAALLGAFLRLHHPALGRGRPGAFTNACIEIETSLDPHALLFTLHKIEKKFGRDRAHETRWGPRTLDLDLIAYDDVRLDKPELTLPHPRAFERAFVLVPLAEIAPDRIIAGRRVATRWRSFRPRVSSGCPTSIDPKDPKTTVWLGGRPVAISGQIKRRPGNNGPDDQD
jgi:2-amino-4-hydroxy-6-hydroxymethyldihydropteridine diphosphokinase